MDIFNHVKSQVQILEIVKQYSQLKKAGTYWKGNCPFHQEKTASFTVTPHREIFYCFGCNEGGDVITFITKAEQCSAIEAVKLLADRYNIELPDTSESTINHVKKDEKERYFALCLLVSQWCHIQLKNNSVAQHYLAYRNIEKKSIGSFILGYFPSGPASIQSLVGYAQKNQILVDDLTEVGILIRSKQKLYSPFEDRIIFPIRDHLGRTCGFGGRTFRKKDTRVKYYNSRDSKFFTKSNLIFGLDIAKTCIQKESTVFLVEGYTDCIAMTQHGYSNTIATLGTACTQEHLQQIARYAEQLHVLYDGDNAGTQAILRLAQLCWQVNLDLKVLLLPKGEDPASYLHQHKTLDLIMAEAKDIFRFFIETTSDNFHGQSLSKKLSLTRKIVELICSIDDPLKQDILIQQASGTLGLPFKSIQKEVVRSARKEVTFSKTAPSATPVPTQHNFDIIPKLEKQIFFAIMHDMQLLNQENEYYIVSCLPAPLNTLIQQLIQHRQQDPHIAFNRFFETLKSSQQHVVTSLLVAFDQPVQKQDFEQLLIQLQKKHWKQIVKDITLKLELAKKTGDQSTVNDILHRFISLKQKIARGLLS